MSYVDLIPKAIPPRQVKCQGQGLGRGTREELLEDEDFETKVQMLRAMLKYNLDNKVEMTF